METLSRSSKYAPPPPLTPMAGARMGEGQSKWGRDLSGLRQPVALAVALGTDTWPGPCTLCTAEAWEPAQLQVPSSAGGRSQELAGAALPPPSARNIGVQSF